MPPKGSKSDPASPKKPESAAAKKAAKKAADKAVKQFLPKKRTPYAIFVSEQYARIQDDVKREQEASGSADQKRPQRLAFDRIGDEWKRLGKKGQEPYQKRAKEEEAAFARAKEQLMSGGANGQPQHGPGSSIGEYELLDTVLWRGTSVAAYAALHKDLRFESAAVVYESQADFRHEVGILQQLWRAEENDAWNCDVFLRVQQAIICNDPVKCIVFEKLPRLSDVLTRSGPLRGHKLQAMAAQLALAVTQLHGLQLLHLDLRPHAAFWNEQDCTLKLGRLTLCQAEAALAAQSQDTAAYTGLYRPPEVWRGATPSRRSESWAYGVTLMECFAGTHPFTDMEQIWSFDATVSDFQELDKRVPAMSSMPQDTRYVCHLFMRHVSDSRMLVEEFLKNRPLQQKLCQQ
ncbi:SRK2B [Symbiodinium natans]|uniref:SRK2B protein n=1 Tax=Symbiodinium natans TaxID=878477 RepID=A0A812IBJ7_9DINO|nr:SRK2B [Symbiodinium natans]CAE7240050.1 SRK2B [Symbiodinium natans]CAE7251379.1 SRK2B [Symbiodinium natans]